MGGEGLCKKKMEKMQDKCVFVYKYIYKCIYKQVHISVYHIYLYISISFQIHINSAYIPPQWWENY